ncbi:glutelin type-B 5-like isoform X2 [Momordica charantia]|uniref:Glutelin type-B 5-like isoform X2 n=1 Tax=Momordica charantia TaxID=3673 RepID=A0A6J1D7H4_MOMCH|nr:glutelin type-B 5-like isoform X2 [Momordica charantia]XP_022149146.1 glutelin type-B 5-like isoform X2 [Momordica charantia]
MVFNLAGAEAERKATVGVSVRSVEESKFPFIGQTGLSASLETLCSNGVRSPIYAADSSVQAIYVVSGSGRVEIVGFNGVKMVAGVKVGHLLVVPKYFVIGKEAGEDGMECFSIVTNLRPVIEELAGKASVWEALSEEVLQVSFNVSADFEKMFISKAANSN